MATASKTKALNGDQAGIINIIFNALSPHMPELERKDISVEQKPVPLNEIRVFDSAVIHEGRAYKRSPDYVTVVSLADGKSMSVDMTKMLWESVSTLTGYWAGANCHGLCFHGSERLMCGMLGKYNGISLAEHINTKVLASKAVPS